MIGSSTNRWIVGNGDFNVGIGTTNPNAAVGVGNTAKLSVGIVSAYQIYGDGSGLTNIPGISTTTSTTFENIVVNANAGIGSLHVTGITTLAGNIFLGYGGSDDINVNGNFISGLVPKNNDTYDLGTSGKYWRNVYISDSVVTSQINVSGVSTFTSAVGINSDLTLTNTNPGSAAGPEFKLFRNSASPADADYLGQIKFAGESDTGVERNYAKITGKILDASNGTEDGIIEFAHIKAGSQVITGRFRSDSFQLLNDTALSVAGDITANGNIAGDGSTNITGIAGVTATTLTGTLQTAAQTNITSLGTLSSLSVTGNVSIGGTLTYDDVTNIDSVGVITAREGIRIGAGKSIGSDGAEVVYYGDGSNLTGTGINTAGNSTFEEITVNGNAGIGSLNVTGVSTFTNNVNTLNVNSTTTNPAINIQFSGTTRGSLAPVTTGLEIQTTGDDNIILHSNSQGGTAGDTLFKSNDITLLTVLGTGNVGIGTTNPHPAVGAGNTAKLSVGILSAYQLYGDASTLTGVASTTILEDAGINTSGTSTFTNIFATGIATAANFDSTSDIRLKTNIEVIQDPLAKVVQIEGVSFNWKQDNRPAFGVIADQVQQILPQLVHGDDPKTVNYNGLIGLLIEAVKEQQIQIDELKSKLS